MEGYPRISIVTPSYNDVEYLESTILSVIGQGYPNLEYIVIDGGSEDGSLKIIEKYASEISYWVSEKDEGMYHALQKGFKESTGEIMGWINSDDKLHDKSLFTAAQIFKDFNKINWIQGHPNSVDESGRIIKVFAWPELNKLYFYKKSRNKARYLQQESTWWRRSLWEKAGSHVSTKFKYAGDFELWMRFFQFDQLYNIPAFIGSFRLSSKGQASIEHFNEYVNETVQILRDLPLTERESKKLKAIENFEFFKLLIERFFLKLKIYFELSDDTTVNNKIYFEIDSQKFDFKK